MPLYQPSNVSPSMLGEFGNGAVIGTYPLPDNYTTFSWQVNGNEPMTAFEITIYKNDASSTQMWTSGKLTDNCPFYGTDAKGNIQLFSWSILYDTLHDVGGLRIYQNYKYTIKQYWGTATEAESITMTSAAAFQTVPIGTITLTNISQGQSISDESYTFTGTYQTGSQIDIPILWARWKLWQVRDGEYIPIYDTGEISTQLISFTYDGFIGGRDYAIQLMLQAESGLQRESSIVDFSVADNRQEWSESIFACPRPAFGGVEVSWPTLLDIPLSEYSFTISPQWQTSYINTILLLKYGSLYDDLRWEEITGSPMSIPSPWTVVWSGWITEEDTESLFEITTTNQNFSATVRNGDTLFARLNGYDIANISMPIGVGGKIVAIATPSQITFYFFGGTKYKKAIGDMLSFSDASNGKMASLVYGEEATEGTYLTLASEWNNPPLVGTASASIDVDEPITRVDIEGPQDAQYIWVVNGNLPTDVVNGLSSQALYQPTWDKADTTLLTNFASQSMTAGSMTIDVEVKKISVYRENQNGAAILIYQTEDTTGNAIVDLSAKSFPNWNDNSPPYTYYLLIDDYGDGFKASVSVTPCLWDWALCSCEENADGSFTPVELYRFRYNVSSGSMSNNNSPSVLQNFTPYPTVLLSPANYKSGVLSGYIGTAKNGSYRDTADQRNALFALSTSQRPMFLRNRNGDFMRVSISSPISAAIADNTREQMQQISVPWVEVGSAELSAVVLDQTDGLYQEIVEENTSWESGSETNPRLG